MRNNSPEKEKILKVKRPFGWTIILAAILLIILLALVETAVRTDFVRDALPAPSIASGHDKLDLKLFLLDNLIKEAGRVDCIFLGGSDMNAAINPELFSRIFEKKTGKKLVCFNFGLSGFIAPAAALMAKIIVEKYHPPLLIWGFTPSSFGDEFKRKPTVFVTRNPWCRYRLGDFNFEGWLIEHSFAYRYFLRFRIWLERPDYSGELSKREERVSRYGYHTRERIGRIMHFKRDEEKETRYREMLSKFDIAAEAASALEQVLRLHSQTKIVLVDIPVHPDLLTLHERGVHVHRKISAYIKRRAAQKGVLFLSTNRLDFITEKGYKDLSHMNTAGAKIFTRWLGIQVANAVRKGLIKTLWDNGPGSTPIEE